SPVPSLTSVKESVTDVAVVPATARFVTLPGFVITGAGTVIVAASLWPSLVAVIVAVPAATPVTSPVFTEAIEELLLNQVTSRPDSALPPASFGVADSSTVCPTGTVADAGVTATEA